MDLIAFDVETWGLEPQFALQPFRLRHGQAWLTSYAFARETAAGKRVSGGKNTIPVDFDGNPIRAAVLMARVAAEMREFLKDCAAKGRTIVCWNAPFDIAWLIAMGLTEEVFACKWLDAMILLRCLENWPTGHPKSIRLGLKETVARFLPELAGYEEGIDFAATDAEAMTKRLAYNKLDCTHTLFLAQTFLARMTEPMRRAALIEARCLPMAAQALVEGIVGDEEGAKTLGEELARTAKVAFVELKLMAPEVTPAVIASPKQLRDMLFKKWGLPVQAMTDPTPTHPRGQASTDRDTLLALADTDERAGLLNTYREAKNNKTKFADGLAESLVYNGDGRTRPAFRVSGTYTMRGTYSSKVGRGVEERPSGCALHQWKRGPKYRGLLRAPAGYTMGELDAAGQEFRWMAVESGDYQMLELCQPGEDAHSFMAAKIIGMDYRAMVAAVAAGDEDLKPKRQLGKVGNLSCQYRTGWPTVRRLAKRDYGLVLSEMEARAVHANYRVSYPRVPMYWKRQEQFGKTYGYAETLTGRRVQLGLDEELWASDKWGWALASTAINFPIQGIGAEQKYLALMVLRDWLPKYGGRLYFELHDGIYMIFPDHVAEKAMREAQKMLNNLPYKQAWGVDLPIKFPWDLKMGPSWGEMKEYK